MSIQSPNLIFAGTPNFAAAHLEALIADQLTPSLVLTQPDRRAGRGKKSQASPVKQIAEQHGLALAQFNRLDADAKAELLARPAPDLLIVVAYGLLLPDWLLQWPRFGAINVHASLLPRWRGAAPIARAIEAGDSETGVAIMQMDTGLDTGAVWQMAHQPITPEMTAAKLHDVLMHLGCQTLLQTLPNILNTAATPTPQTAQGVTYAKKLSKAEAKINWQESGLQIGRKIRAFNPAPVAYTQLAETTYRILAARFIATTELDRHDLLDQNLLTGGLQTLLSSAQLGEVIAETDSIWVRCHDGVVAIEQLQEMGKKSYLLKSF